MNAEKKEFDEVGHVVLYREVVLTDDDVSAILDSLRETESRSRSGFARWVRDNLNSQRLEERMKKAQSAIIRIQQLRNKLGDSSEVRIK